MGRVLSALSGRQDVRDGVGHGPVGPWNVFRRRVSLDEFNSGDSVRSDALLV